MLYFTAPHRAEDLFHQEHPVQANMRRGLRQVVLMLGLMGMLFSLTSCVELEGGPKIVTVSVDPSTIQFNRYNGLVTVLISIDGFEGEIVEADAFIQLSQGDQRKAQKDSFTADARMIELNGISRSWFEGQPPGTYQVGASVVSDAGESIEQLDLATVTITD